MKTITTTIIATLVAALLASTAMAQPGRWRGNQHNTYGWQLMTREERTEHQTKMRSFTDYNACKEYVAEHHKQMEERAKEKGLAAPVMKQNPCDTLKSRGVVK
jgi:hypothetical protein